MFMVCMPQTVEWPESSNSEGPNSLFCAEGKDCRTELHMKLVLSKSSFRDTSSSASDIDVTFPIWYNLSQT